MAQLNFDASTVEPNAPIEAIPAGWYIGTVTGSEMKPTRAGDGSYLNLELTINQGEYAGRKLFDALNLNNPNQTAMEIAYRTLSAICHATNVLNVQDSQQLHGIPLAFKVSVRPAGPGADGKHYDASNEVKGYAPANEHAGNTGQGQAAPTGHQNTGAPTWAGQQQQPAAQQEAPQEQPTQQAPAQQQEAPAQTAQADSAPKPPWVK